MKKSAILFLTIIFSGSCTLRDFEEDINLDPNNPSNASAPQLLANAMLSLQDIGESTTGEFLGQYLSETQYVVTSRYPQEGTSFYGWYEGPLVNLQTVLNTATAANHLAVAKILKAYYIWHITDRWGDVPFSEALQGAADFTPKYDTQESIYSALFDLLEEAQAQLDESIPLSGDIMYGGDMAQWKKFANTIRMLMALRLSEVTTSTIDAEAEFNAALTAGVMESNDDNFVFYPNNEGTIQNYWHTRVIVDGDEWWALTGTLVDIMEPVNDPRLPVYGAPARTSGEFIGLPIGTAPNGAAHTENYSLIGPAILDADHPVYLVTYAQSLFARAEAAARNWTNEDAETNYNDAVENSILQWTGSTVDVAGYLAEPEVIFDSNTAIEQISTQRYIHLFLHGYEAWAEWRRTGFPAFALSNGNEVPTRQSYVADESFNNTDNYTEAVQRQFNGEDDMYGRVWWDVD